MTTAEQVAWEQNRPNREWAMKRSMESASLMQAFHAAFGRHRVVRNLILSWRHYLTDQQMPEEYRDFYITAAIETALWDSILHRVGPETGSNRPGKS